MGHGLIAAEQSRDSPVDVYLYSSRRGPCIPRGEAKPTHGRDAERDAERLGSLSGEGMYRGSHPPPETVFVCDCFCLHCSG